MLLVLGGCKSAWKVWPMKHDRKSGESEKKGCSEIWEDKNLDRGTLERVPACLGMTGRASLGQGDVPRRPSHSSCVGGTDGGLLMLCSYAHTCVRVWVSAVSACVHMRTHMPCIFTHYTSSCSHHFLHWVVLLFWPKVSRTEKCIFYRV